MYNAICKDKKLNENVMYKVRILDHCDMFVVVYYSSILGLVNKQQAYKIKRYK